MQFLKYVFMGVFESILVTEGVSRRFLQLISSLSPKAEAFLYSSVVVGLFVFRQKPLIKTQNTN